MRSRKLFTPVMPMQGAPAIDMQCVILAGGLGTRLGALTARTPKPLLPVAGRPFLDHLIDEIARFGVRRFLILAGHLGERMAAHYAPKHVAPKYVAPEHVAPQHVSRDGQPLQIDVVIEPEPLGTGGGLALFADRIDDLCLLVNGDTFFDLNITDFLHPPLDPSSLMRMAVRREPEPGRYGTVQLAADSGGLPSDGTGTRVAAFREKTDDGEAALVNAGAYLVRKDVVGLIDRLPCSLERDLMPRLVARNALEARCYSGLFIDIGVPAELTRAQSLFPIRRPAVFFDRDGVLNEDSGYTHRPESLRWLPGAREAIRMVNDGGRLAFVVTNQAGVARGFYDERAVRAFHAEMQAQLAPIGAHVDAFVFCPHHPEGAVADYARSCDCRKPAPGMIKHLLERWPIRRDQSLLIGDRPSDMAAAAAAGIEARLYTGGDLRTYLPTS